MKNSKQYVITNKLKKKKKIMTFDIKNVFHLQQKVIVCNSTLDIVNAVLKTTVLQKRAVHDRVYYEIG